MNISKIVASLTDQTAPGSKAELRDGSNVGMDGGIHNHSFDLSTRDAINLMNQRKAEGKPVTGDDMKAVIKNLADSGQITREEWMDLREYVTANYDSLSPEAKAAYDKLDTALQAGGNQVGWFDGKFDGKTRNDAVVKGTQLKTLLEDIDGKPKGKDSVDKPETTGHGTGGTGGAGTGGSGGVKEPSSGPASGSSGTSKAGGPGAGAGWGEIIAYLMQLIDAKEKELKNDAMNLAGQIDGVNKKTNEANSEAAKGGGGAEGAGGAGGAGGGGQVAADKSLNAQLAEVQDNMKKLDQLTEMLTNLLNSTHQTTSKVIGNLR
jgi:hypothetical protein